MSENSVKLNEVSSGTILNGSVRTDNSIEDFHGGQHRHYTRTGTMQGNIKSVVQSDRTYHARGKAEGIAKSAVTVILIVLILAVLLISLVSIKSSKVIETDYMGNKAYAVPMSDDDLTMLDFISGSVVSVDDEGVSRVYTGAMPTSAEGDLLIDWDLYCFASYVSYEDDCLYMYDTNGYMPTLDEMKELQGYINVLASDLDDYYG